MKKLLVILPAIFPFLAAAPTLPADFLVVFVEAGGFFCLSCWSPKRCTFQCSRCIGLIINSIKLLASESQRTF